MFAGAFMKFPSEASAAGPPTTADMETTVEELTMFGTAWTDLTLPPMQTMA